MSVVVISCGRTGTNVALEILRGNPSLNASLEPENKKLVKPVVKYPKNYLTKCDTIYFDVDQFTKLMDTNPDMKIIWTIRDPRDIVLSKIYRGQPFTDGRGNWTSADGTPETSVADIRAMIKKYNHALENYGDRIILIKLEDMIENTETVAKTMCDFIGVEYNDKMLDFPMRMRNKHKVKRYGRKIQTSQVGLWKNYNEIYDGFFAKQKYDISDTFGEITDIVEFFNYDL
jgi:hypothetical protein